MQYVIDILAVLILLSFLLAGWHKGSLLSLLGIVRVVLSYGAAYFSGRYIGFWLGEVTHRPRIVTIPVIAGLTFVIISFIFHVVIVEIRAHHKEKEEKENYHLPIPSCIGGGIINLGAGILSMILLFWLADLALVGVTGRPTPGVEKSYFGSFVRRAVYETAYFVVPKNGNASQVAAMARMVSDPSQGLEHLQNLLAAESVKQLLADEEFTKDVLSGDVARIQNNASLQQLFDDPAALEELKELGIISGRETKTGLCEKLSGFGANEKIQVSMETLKEKGLLSTDKITLLIRDPDFDVIIGELAK